MPQQNFFMKETTLEGEGKSLKPDEMIDYLKNLVNKYQIVSLEDPLEENDWAGWAKLTKECGGLQIVGDDIFVTQRKLYKRALMKSRQCNFIKLNQIGTLTETLSCIELAKQHNFGTIISHRSGETEDTFISDLAVATDTKQIKTGAPARSDRTAKYNRLLVINDELYHEEKNNIVFIFLIITICVSGLLILLDIFYQDYSTTKNKELKNLIITKEKELILLSEQNENLKNNIRLLKENLDNENADILNEEEIILNELETNEEPN